MINKIKTQYNTYNPNEFLPIYEGGVLANRRAFHAYKLRQLLTPVVERFLHTI